MSTPTNGRRIMFITGGSRGIGATLVHGAVQHGFDVAFTFRTRQDAARALCERITVTTPSARCRAYRLDVRDSVEVERVGDRVLADFGAVHVVVPNAAIAHDALAFVTTDDEWHAVLDTNLTGAFYVARYFVPELVTNGFGRIIFISSVAARGVSGEAAYSASKAGLLGLSGALAKEYGGRGVTSNAVVLGAAPTSAVVAVVMHLASDAAGLVNGQEIGVMGPHEPSALNAR
jgi:3-oxoacyl-[acyl-carrier protein] reductase